MGAWLANCNNVKQRSSIKKGHITRPQFNDLWGKILINSSSSSSLGFCLQGSHEPISFLHLTEWRLVWSRRDSMHIYINWHQGVKVIPCLQLSSGETYLMQLLLCGKTQTIDSVGPAVCPLTKLLWCLCECHAGGESAVDDGLQYRGDKIRHEKQRSNHLFHWIDVKEAVL